MSIARVVLLAIAFIFALPGIIYAGQFNDQLDQVFTDLSGSYQDDTEFLDPDQAFVFSYNLLNENTLQLNWEIAEGYYLYRDNFRFTLEQDIISIGTPVISKGKLKEDPDFGRVEVLHHYADIVLPLIKHDPEVTELDMVVTYQGCKEDVICYPPVNKSLTLKLPAGLSRGIQVAVIQTSNNKIIERLLQGNIIISIIAFFGFGLLAAFSACVYPMIPILSGIIVGQNKRVTTRKAFTLSLAYVLPIAITYSLLGIIAAKLGYNLQAAAQHPWVISVFSAVFVMLALSMFGLFELSIPGSWQTRLTAISNNQERGSFYGAAVMGALSAVIVGPCVTPPLFAGITFIGQTGDVLLGGAALFAFGLGLGAPLLVIGTSLGKLLPRAGLWMKYIQRFFGIVMLAVAIWFLERIIPGPLALLLWAALFITTALFSGALDALPPNATWQKLSKGMAIMILVYGVLLVIGAAKGNDNIFKPLQGVSGKTIGESQPEFDFIKSNSDLDRALSVAKQNNQVTMLDFYADWCIDCKKMERQTFNKKKVHTALNSIMLLKADVTRNDELDRNLLTRFNLPGPPAILFFDREGHELKTHRLIGFIDAESFIVHINQIVQL